MPEEENTEIPKPIEVTQNPASYEPMETSGEMYNTPNYPQMSSDETQRMIEAVVEEKWNDFAQKFGDIIAWKAQVGDDLESVKQEILRLQKRFDTLQAAVVGKVGDYSQGIKDISTEMKALEKVFEKIIDPLTQNIRELNRVTQTLKGKVPSKKVVKK